MDVVFLVPCARLFDAGLVMSCYRLSATEALTKTQKIQGCRYDRGSCHSTPEFMKILLYRTLGIGVVKSKQTPGAWS